MNTMEALRAGQALSPKGEASGLNLGADAETLALFASLFAMMQSSQSGSGEGGKPPSDSQALQMEPGSENGNPALPAAAMLMAGLAPTAEIADKTMPPGEVEAGEGDTAGLLKLLLAAHDIAAPDQQPVAPISASDDTADATAPARTATEMLTGAIEILKALEMPPVADDLSKGPSPELIGPMPAVSLTGTVSAPAVAMVSPSQDFIGPMPAVNLTGTVSAPAVAMVSPSPEFVGPIPAATRTGSVPASIIMEHAEADFIGPMPLMTLSTSSTAPSTPMPLPMVLQAEPEIIGPMPAVTTQTTLAAPAVVLLHADRDFIGPMPAVATSMPAPSQEVIAAATSAMSANAGTNTGPSLGTSLTHSTVTPNDLQRQADQALKLGPPEAGPSNGSAEKDEGFVSRRADILASSNGMTEKIAEQKMAADIQATRMAALRAGAETAQGSSASTSAPFLAQQLASSLTNSQGTAANAQDMSQDAASNTVPNTAGSQNGNQSGGQAGNQSGAQQMVDGGVSRGSADRTLLHRLNTDNADWSETMVKRLTADLRSGVQNVRIILEPRQLGRLSVELGLRNGQTSIRIAAETQEAAKLLSSARSQLGHMLESVGLRLAGFQATGSQAGDAGLDNNQGSQGRGGDAAGDHDTRNNAGRNQEFSNKIATALDETADDAMIGEGILREGETAVLSILA